MDDGSALILTVATYFTPGNKDIPSEGVPPTAEVHPSIDDLLAQADLTQPAAAPSSSPDDPVVKKALELLQGGAAVEKKAAKLVYGWQQLAALDLNSHGAGRIFAACAALVLLFLAGCAKKNLSKSELRAITGEIVSAAQKINGHKSEIAIRPELQPAKRGSSSALAADNIYISLSDPSQIAAFAQALNAIARKHDLSISETISSGVIRFDYAFHSARTHTIHVVTPLAARAAAPHSSESASASARHSPSRRKSAACNHH